MTDFLKSISARLQALIPGDMQKQMKAGYRDEQLGLTERGAKNLLEILADVPEYQAALTAKAEVRIAAQAQREADEKAACRR